MSFCNNDYLYVSKNLLQLQVTIMKLFFFSLTYFQQDLNFFRRLYHPYIDSYLLELDYLLLHSLYRYVRAHYSKIRDWDNAKVS